MKARLRCWLWVAGISVLAGCDWQYDVTFHGVSFARVRTEPSGYVIGYAASDVVVGGRHCRQGWIQLHPNGVPALFATAVPIDLGRFVVPADSWVFQNPEGGVTVCAFPRDTVVQGHLCGGSGGAKGTQTAFYPDGGLKEFFPVAETRIDGVLCRPGPMHGYIVLYETGRLKRAWLAEDVTRDGRTLPKGSRIVLDAQGALAGPEK